MENVMQRTDALKWFWQFMLVATLAAATIIAFPPFVTRASADEPRFRMVVQVVAPMPHVSEATPVTLEPSCIEVKAKRPTPVSARFASGFAQRRQAS
jgi:hypothetical protein